MDPAYPPGGYSPYNPPHSPDPNVYGEPLAAALPPTGYGFNAPANQPPQAGYGYGGYGYSVPTLPPAPQYPGNPMPAPYPANTAPSYPPMMAPSMSVPHMGYTPVAPQPGSPIYAPTSPGPPQHYATDPLPQPPMMGITQSMSTMSIGTPPPRPAKMPTLSIPILGFQLHGILKITVVRGINLPAGDMALAGGQPSSDPYVIGKLGKHRLFRTEVHDSNLNPVFNETFYVDVAATAKHQYLTFRICDMDLGQRDDKLGVVKVACSEIRDVCVRFHVAAGCIHVYSRTRDRTKNHRIKDKRAITISPGVVKNNGPAFLEFEIEYFPYQAGLELRHEAPFTYFPLREGNRVTLFADAHVPAGVLPPVVKATGETHVPRACWEETYLAIQAAQHFIYVTGWAVWPELEMLRERPLDKAGFPTLGQMLKQKAEEGVTVCGGCIAALVCVMVWDELTSTDSSLMQGMMGTHDQECKKYFKDSKVIFKQARRAGLDDSRKATSVPGKMMKVMAKMVHNTSVSGQFTHHQKTVMCDAASAVHPSKRHVVAFVGGLDLTDGRWDTPAHPLFRTLKQQHVRDYYMCIKGCTQDVGPREPWHDIHSKIEGPTARDVVRNFEERWTKQAPKLVHHLVSLPALASRGVLFTPEEETMVTPDAWSVQMFRSIDARSAEFERSTETTSRLNRKKGRAFDASIHRAYCHHIRRAQNHLYFENQYWIGGSQDWQTPTNGAPNLVPLEVCGKIREKILAEERFAAYIVVPMFAEGEPDSATVQPILHMQWATIQLMYRMVADAIKEKGIDAHPTDYLNFYCLGNRETEDGSQGSSAVLTSQMGPKALSLWRHRRFMIYVHSKMLLVDDEVAIVGSANINQRSLDGCRDTETAIGAFQPAHTMWAAGGQLPKGEVHAFRMQLWGEHLGVLENVFLDPSSLECVRRVNAMAQHNWDVYAGDQVQEMHGHLLKYPIKVGKDGMCTPLVQTFPDFPNAKVIGSTIGIERNMMMFY